MSGCILSEVERVFCGFVAIWRAAVVSSQSGHKTLRLLQYAMFVCTVIYFCIVVLVLC